MKQKTFLKQNMANKVLLIIVVLWMIWFIGSAIVGQVRDVFVQSQEVQYVTLEHVETGYGMVYTTEHVIPARVDGTAESIIAEGERVRKGNAVFRIGEEYHHTDFSGRVSYHIDGLENMTDIGTISQLDLKQYYQAQQKNFCIHIYMLCIIYVF